MTYLFLKQQLVHEIPQPRELEEKEKEEEEEEEEKEEKEEEKEEEEEQGKGEEGDGGGRREEFTCASRRLSSLSVSECSRPSAVMSVSVCSVVRERLSSTVS